MTEKGLLGRIEGETQAGRLSAIRWAKVPHRMAEIELGVEMCVSVGDENSWEDCREDQLPRRALAALTASSIRLRG